MSEEGRLLIHATEAIISNVQEQTNIIFSKLNKMQEIYLEKNKSLYTTDQLENIKQIFKSVLFKFLLTDIHLEQLWSLSMVSRSKLLSMTEPPKKIIWTKNQEICGYLYLESFLFEARSFVDILLNYICLILGKKEIVFMSKRKFDNYIKMIKDPKLRNKATMLQNYINKIFSKGHWGSLLRDLRNKIAHQKHLIPSFKRKEKNFETLLDWPTIQGKTFDRFCQDIENGMFEIFRELFPILFDLEWKSGPYKANLWDNK